MNLSIVIPVYNSEETLVPLAERLAKVLPGLAGRYEVILVNDGSRDHSWDVIMDLTKRYPWVLGIDLMRNYGQHNATLCGIRAARYEVIVTMDDDLQHLPEEISPLLTKLQEGYDLVYGIPKKQPHNWWRSGFSILIKYVLSHIIRVKTIRDIGSFRAFHSRLRIAFEHFNGPDVQVDVLLFWGTKRVAAVTIEESPRKIGTSNYSFLKLVHYALVVLTGFSTVPLRFASIMGFCFTIIGIMGFFYVVGIYFVAGSVPGFPFLASIILVFSGAQLFALGIIGEYLARIFERTSGQMPYTIVHIASKTPIEELNKV